MLHYFTDLVFPPVSLSHQPGTWLTDAERVVLRAHPLRFEGVALLKHGIPAVDRLVAGTLYGSSPLLREAVRRFKYRRVRAYEDVLGRMLAETSLCLPEWPPAVLCPVPLHWTRFFFRGFNQARVLADAVHGARGWPVQDLLVRTRPTGSQAKRSREDRIRALRGAFAWRKGLLVPQRVVLVDDVATSGATLDACAIALKEAGVRRVDAVTLAVAFA